MSITKEFDSLRIPLLDIKLATNNFGKSNCIGQGGFGKVYHGELVHSGQHVAVAVKRLDPRFGQGTAEFWQEIIVLSHYKHENIVSLLGFSNEADENVLVYEYLPNKSLDVHLGSTSLSWVDRLNICIGAARGLVHLHSSPGQVVLHRDIKSSNILLDANWNAKISDFGLSSIIPTTNKEFPFHISHAAGTPGYCDPQHVSTGFLTKEIDVYSFGVVLFEVLCGRLCTENHKDGYPTLSELAKSCYERKLMRKIALDCLQDQISPSSLDKFSTIAYRCLQRDHTKRPSISEIIRELKVALACQVSFSQF
ncbi:hypothetical protein SSX86_005245 [Deinandra increscens subsp. villosa]|uniref:Protein kinase domain-containing protein n=1 Tax=Deinandra increscens subsp. villosa TaxID=3103831 RepID=A0AAP0DPH3_9ASTR